MKKLLIALLLAALALGTAALAENVGIANPWAESTAEAIEAALGVPFGVPDDAENVSYRLLEDDNLAEMEFTWYGMDYCARMQPAAEFTDISGLYYETWDTSMDDEVGGCSAIDLRTRDGDMTVDLCLWYDADMGLMYSLTTGGPDLDGFDILAAAQIVHAPALASE